MELMFRRAVFDHDVLALDEACFLQALTEGGHEVHSVSERGVPQAPDHRHLRLLRARRERPCNRRATEQRDELAPFDAEHGGVPPLSFGVAVGGQSGGDGPLRPVYRTLNLPQQRRQVLGSDLNRSEWGLGAARPIQRIALQGVRREPTALRDFELADVRFAPKADKYADISLSPLCAISQHDRALLLPRRRGEPCRWDPETYALARWSPHT